MSKVFVSFRRGDTTALANRIYDRLANFYTKREVLNDIGYIPTSGAQAEYVREKLRDYQVLLVIVGPAWINARNRSQELRLTLPDDPVRLELLGALTLPRPIVAVLADGASLPTPDELPMEIRGFASIPDSGVMNFRGDAEFNADMRRLYRVLGNALAVQEVRHTPPVPDPREPSLARQAILRPFRESRRPPHVGFRIETLGELYWVTRRTAELGAGQARSIDLKGVDLSYTNLAGAQLASAYLSEANLSHTNLSGAQLEGANLTKAHLDATDLRGASLRKAVMNGQDLHTAFLGSKTDLSEAQLHEAKLGGLDLTGVMLASANLSNADLQGADLTRVDLSETVLQHAHLENADLPGSRLVDANLREAHLGGADLRGADLEGADIDSFDLLKQVAVNQKTRLEFARWDGVRSRPYKGVKGRDRLLGYRDAVRVNHQVSKALRDQGLLSLASDYRLREQSMQRRVLWAEHRYPRWLFSWLLNLVAGYGERLGRTVLIYLVLILGFAGAFYGLTQFAIPGERALTPYEAIILSLGSFHGRSLLSSGINLSDPIAAVAALEAIVGLFIELIFIAAFSRRFLGD